MTACRAALVVALAVAAGVGARTEPLSPRGGQPAAAQMPSGPFVIRDFTLQFFPHLGSGFSASPVAADNKIYLSNEDGEILVVAAGLQYKHIATNSMGELLMATPLSDGVMYVRSAISSPVAAGLQARRPRAGGRKREAGMT